MKMTPRQLNAFVHLRERRRMGERADLMRDIRIAQHGDAALFRKTVKQLDDESQ